MSVKPINLVKYAGEYWVTLADFTATRSTKGYSDHASVKSAIRTFVVRKDSDKYVAFRGELQIKNIIAENKHNPMFYPEDFIGHTRTALIHYSMLDVLNERFSVSKEYKQELDKFMKEADELMSNSSVSAAETAPEYEESAIVRERSTMLRHLRSELSRLEKEIEVRQNNREKILQAINAMESLESEHF